MLPPLQAPADVEGCRANCIGVGKGDKCLQGHSSELGPRLHAAGVSQGKKGVEVVAVIPGAGIGRARLEHPPCHPQGQRDVAPRPRLHEQIAHRRGLVEHWIDGNQLRPAGPRLEENRDQVHARDVEVFSPQDDRAGAGGIEEVVAVLVAEVGHLGGIASAGADIPRFDGDRPEALEEIIDDAFEDPHRSAAAVGEDRCRPRFRPDRHQSAGDVVEGLLPGNRYERVADAAERGGEPVRSVLTLEEPAGAVAEEALRHRMGRVAGEARDPPILDGGHDPAGIGAITVAGRETAFPGGRIPVSNVVHACLKSKRRGRDSFEPVFRSRGFSAIPDAMSISVNDL